MEPIISYASDRIASSGYLLAIVVCMAWMGIAISHAAARRYVVRWATLAGAMALAGGSFLLMGIYTGWRVIPYSNTLAMTRIGFALAAVVGAVFTVLYLISLWRKGN